MSDPSTCGCRYCLLARRIKECRGTLPAEALNIVRDLFETAIIVEAEREDERRGWYPIVTHEGELI